MNVERVAQLLRELASLFTEARADGAYLDDELLALAGRAEVGPYPVATPHVYLLVARHAAPVKIGWTACATRARVTALQTGSPTKLTAAFTITGERDTEAALHRAFATHRTHGEWFNLDDQVALFVGACARNALRGFA